MIWFLQLIVAVLLFCPFTVLLLVYVIGKKMKLSSVQAFGYGADLTTAILFLSVSLAIKSVWQLSVFLWIIIAAAMIAILFTYRDWRTKKEIEVLPLLRRIWRFYFIVLVFLYIIIVMVGITFSVLDYMNIT